MRERARDKGRLQDIIDYSDNVAMLIEGHSLETFVADKRTYYSVIKNVEVVGEAAYMLTKAFKKAHPATPWKIVQGMRHVLVHDYAVIDDKELYNTAINDIPVLRMQVKQYLDETDWQAWISAPDEYDVPDNDKMIETVRRMKAKGYTVEDIAEITGLTAEEIEGL
jgi:uncharacterized protein with HEPN domain